MNKPALKAKMFAKQSGICVYCDCAMTLKKVFGLEHRQATIDHIVASSNHGLDDPINMVLACLHCNRHKRSHTPETLRRMADVIDRLMFERGLDQAA